MRSATAAAMEKIRRLSAAKARRVAFAGTILARACCLIVISFAAALHARAAVYQEDFSTNPSVHGWRAFGNSNLFRWNATNANLEVTWDSSQTNSYFYFPFGTVLAKTDDFSFTFDLRLKDIQIGSTSGRPSTFQISAGFLNYRHATNASYFRGAGTSPTYGMRNFLEWDFFPDDGYGATWATTVVSTNLRYLPAHNFPLELTTGDVYQITLSYAASNQTLRTSALKNGAPYGLPPNNSLQSLILTSQPDFRLDAFAIMSYSDAVQVGTMDQWGSILAHGVVDNINLTLPAPILPQLTFLKTNAVPRVQLTSKTNWTYTLERTTNLNSWVTAYPATNGNGSILSLPDATAPMDRVFYRVRAERP